MRVSHVVDSVSRNAGGVFFSVNSLAHALARHEIGLSVHGLQDAFSEEDRAAWSPIPLHLHRAVGPRGIGFSPGLTRALLAGSNDLLHVHGAWQAQSHSVNIWHRRTRRPYLISLHGMLDPWALSRSRCKKWLAALAYERVHLGNAKCLHALCPQEVDSIRNHGLGNPVCLLPNGVDLPTIWRREPRATTGSRVILFLGRLHPKKGLANALRAWARTHRELPDWQFVIAGWDQGGHGEELKQLCKELGLSSSDHPVVAFVQGREGPGNGGVARVVFAGPAFGGEKDALLRRADAFILPSFSEGLPMAVLEAWAYGIPVLMTDHCNLPEGFAAGAAIRIGTTPGDIVPGFRELSGGSPHDLEAMGAKGRSLVEARFTWPKIASQMKEVYGWLCGDGPRPGFVE